MTTSGKILVVGASGYLGLNIVKQLQEQGQDFIALARSKQKLLMNSVNEAQIIEAQVTDATQLEGVCQDVDVVISCLGITRQKDGLSYMDVDYQANLNVLLEAEKAGVQQFIYVSAFKAQDYPQVRLLQAKEKFAERLLKSQQLSPCVIRPNGFFADLEELYHMAHKGKIYQFGHGEVRMNPISGRDLARFCLSKLGSSVHEFDVGGPEVLSMNQLAKLAFASQNKPSNIASMPDVIRRLLLWCCSKMPERWTGPVEFFLTMLGSDAIAPCFGEDKIEEHFAACNDQRNLL